MRTTVSSQLMPNHVAGRPLHAQTRLHTVYSAGQTPLLFSLDEAAAFRLTLPSATSPTGWEQVDLGAQLSGPVRTFHVAQDAEAGLWLVVAAGSQVYVSERLANSASAKDWSGLAGKLAPRAIPSGLTVTDIFAGDPTPSRAPFSVVVCKDGGGQVRYHQLNPDPAGSWSSLPLPLPQNATACLAVEVGRHPKLGTGVYSLFSLGVLRSLVFSSLPKKVGERTLVNTIELDLPAALDPYGLATAALPDGQTELYVAGDGVYRYSPNLQRSSHLGTGELVADVTGVRELTTATDPSSGRISLWTRDIRDALTYLEGRRTDQGYTWQPPLLVDTEVTALSAYRERGGGVAMAVGGSDGSFRMLTRDPQTTLWRPQTLSVLTKAHVVTLQTYTTRLALTDDAGVPLRGQAVTIEPDRDCTALVNGRHYALRAGIAKPAATDLRGVLTVVLETADLTAPTYTFRPTGGPTVTSDPAAATKDTLRGLTSQKIATASRSDGKPLFTTSPSQQTCDAAASAVTALMKAHDSVSGVPSTDLTPTQVNILFTEAGPNLQPLELSTAFTATDSPNIAAGDLLAAMADAGATVGSFLIQQAEAGWEFIVDLGGRAFKFLIELPQHAVAAIKWALTRLLNLSLEDIVAWLGFVFAWDDILANHRALAKVADLSLDHMVTYLLSLKGPVDEWFTALRTKLNTGKLVVDQSSDIFAHRVGTAAPHDRPAALDQPPANWASHQFGTNLEHAESDPVRLEDLSDVLAALADDEIAIVRQAVDQLGDLFGAGLQDLTFTEVLQAVLEVVSLALVNTLENLTLTLIDLAAVLLATLRTMMTTRWEIPVLTPLYEQVICRGDGSRLTLLDLLCLLAAVPTTVVAKAVTGRNLFTPAQLTLIDTAPNWQTLTNTFQTPDHALTASATSDLNPLIAFVAALQFVTACLREVSAVASAFRDFAEMTPVIKSKITLVKGATDLTIWGFGVLGTILLVPTSKPASRAREILDGILTATGFVPVLREALTYYWEESKTGPPGGPDVLRYVETVFGGYVLVMTGFSLYFQIGEPPSSTATPAEQRALLGLKASQNITGGLNALCCCMLAQPLASDPDVKRAGQILRAVFSQLRVAALVARTVLQLDTLDVDFEGLIP